MSVKLLEKRLGRVVRLSRHGKTMTFLKGAERLPRVVVEIGIERAAIQFEIHQSTFDAAQF